MKDDARRVKTRIRLREAMLDLLATGDFADITAQRVVAHAGIGYATFFRHYAGVDALLVDLADDLMTKLIAQALPALSGGNMREVISVVVRFVAAHRNAATALLVGGGDTVRHEITRRANDYTTRLPLPIEPQIPRELGVEFVVTGAITILRWWLSVGQRYSAARVEALIARLLVEPLAG